MLRELDPIFQTLETHSGITIANAHREYMEKLILERTVGMDISASEYNALIKRDDGELSYLTNAAAVNETYFFREEKQFDFLKNEVFLPRTGDTLNIWSASCSTGEEPLSIYALAKDCGVKVSVSASDIDTDALAKFRAGVYTKNSFRTDGSKYLPLIEQEGSWDGDKMTISPDTLSQINIFQYNLACQSAPPVQDGSMDIIFMRNVFIYFTNELRLRILAKMSKSLKEGGLLILSINEVGNIDRKLPPFEKLHAGVVYYLRKSPPESLKAAEKKPLVVPVIKKIPEPVRLPPLPKPAVTVTPEAEKMPKPRAACSPATENNCSIQELYGRIKDSLDRHDPSSARKSLSKKVFKPHEMEFKYFFSALIYIEEKNKDEALAQLEKAAMLNPSFWPASYGMGFLQKKAGNEAESCKNFASCKRAIESYKQEGKKDFDFLMGQFSPEYFEMLCTNYLKGTGEGQT